MSVKKIRAIDRALMVIEALSQSRSLSLVQLRQKTGLDNATLLRILTTLIDRGWVRQLIVEKRYELSHRLETILGSVSRAHPMRELAAPVLLELKSNPYSLPSDLCAVIGDGLIEIVESTRLRGPMAPARTGLGLRPSLFKSAHGRAILAAMPEPLRKRHIDSFLNRARKDDILWYNNGFLDRELAMTTERGYSIRETHYWEPPFDDAPAFGAIAVCIQNKTAIYGSVSLLWLEEDISLETVINAGLADGLKSAAEDIAEKLAKNKITAPSPSGF